MKRTLILCVILLILTALVASDDLMGLQSSLNDEIPAWEPGHTWGEGTSITSSGHPWEGEDLETNEGILLCSDEFILILSSAPCMPICIVVF